jgi:nicotinamidase-related amidase
MTQSQRLPAWRQGVPEEDQEIYAMAGLGRPVGPGRKPALLVIDVQYRTVGTVARPVRQAIGEYNTSCGKAGWEAVPHIARVIACCRQHRLPVIYPYVAPKDAWDRGRFADKVRGIMDIPQDAYSFVRDVAPSPEDLLVPKKHASAFFGTPLASHLVALGVDSLLFTGCTTSGCVRASVVDACSLNYKAQVLEDAVFDRSKFAHCANLFDMASKYADVVTTDDAIETIRATPA